MATIIKIANKRINLDRLTEELETAGIPLQGLLLAGFNRLNVRVNQPNASTKVIATGTGKPDDEADPGELRFTYDPALTTAEETTLDGVLVAHDHTVNSNAQDNQDQDAADAESLANDHREWNDLSNAQKDENQETLSRLTARLQDRSIDI